MADIQEARIYYYENEIEPLKGRRLFLGVITHWLNDNFDPSCNDTWRLYTLGDEDMRRTIEAFDPEIDANMIIKLLAGIEDEIGELDGKNADVLDYAKPFVNSIQMDCSRILTLKGLNDYDDFDEDDEIGPGTYVENIIIEFEDQAKKLGFDLYDDVR